MSEKAQHETWREWCAFGAPGSDPWRELRGSPGPWLAGDHLPDPELVTREALLLKLERWGVQGVTARNLRHWEDAGLVPRATREGPPGKQRALYPWWAAELVARLRQLQDEGIPTPRLIDRLRAEAHHLSRDRSRAGGDTARSPVPPPDPFASGDLAADAAWLVGECAPTLLQLLPLYRQYTGVALAALALVVTTEGGERVAYPVYPLPETNREGAQ